MTEDKSNPAQIRGDIHKGLSGDKRHGFDPAMAPLETDSEAAGTPLTQEQIAMARETQAHGRPDRSMPEYSSAMRPPDPAQPKTGHLTSVRPILIVVGIVVIAAIVIVGLG